VLLLIGTVLESATVLVVSAVGRRSTVRIAKVAAVVAVRGVLVACIVAAVPAAIRVRLVRGLLPAACMGRLRLIACRTLSLLTWSFTILHMAMK
jgi:hypothetical protein